MKKLLCLLLAFAMVFALGACTRIVDVPDNKDDVNAIKDAIMEFEEYDDDYDDDDNESVVIKDVDVEKTVLVDEDDIKITVEGFESDSYEASFGVLIENNTNIDLTFSTEIIIANGYVVNGSMYEDVSAGKKANGTIDIYQSSLELAGFDVINDVELIFTAYDSDEYETVYESDMVKFSTTAKEKAKSAHDISQGTVAYNKDGYKIIILDTITESDDYDAGVVVYLESSSKKNICVTTEDVSVNGFMINEFFYETLPAGNYKSISVLEVDDSDLEENNIDKIEEMEITFRAYDADKYNDIFETDSIVIKF